MSTVGTAPEASPQGGNAPESSQPAPQVVAQQVPVQEHTPVQDTMERMMDPAREQLIASIFGEDIDRSQIRNEQRALLEKQVGYVPPAQPEEVKAAEIPQVQAPQQTIELVGDGKRFKTQADLEKSYRELEGEYTRRTQEWSRVMKTAGVDSQEAMHQAVENHNWVENVYKPWLAQTQGQGQPVEAGQQLPQQVPQQAQTPAVQRLLSMDKDAILDKLTEDPVGTFQQMFREAMLDQRFVEQTVPELAATRLRDKLFDEFNKLSDQYPDVEQVTPIMTSLYNDVPGMRQKTMEEVYWLAKGRMYDELVKTQKNVITDVARKATEAAYQNQDAKLRAAVDGAVSTEPGTTQTKDSWDELLEHVQKGRVVI